MIDCLTVANIFGARQFGSTLVNTLTDDDSKQKAAKVVKAKASDGQNLLGRGWSKKVPKER